MKSTSPIVSNGGWITRETIQRPWTNRFASISAWWTAFSAVAWLAFWEGWPETLTPLHWACGAVLLPLPVLIGITLALRLTEKSRAVTDWIPNPDFDPRKLY